MTLDQFKTKSKKIPDTPGVYFFLGSKKEVLYIGKATSLRDRVRSYFAPDIAEVRSQLIANMVAKAKSIDWRQTDSVLEALILEAHLIKNYKPHYNTDEKDDKSWNYVVITNEEFPIIELKRGKELQANSIAKAANDFRTSTLVKKSFAAGASTASKNHPLARGLHKTTPLSLDEPFQKGSFASATENGGYLYVFGPFPHGLQLKEALKLIRKIFPYRDTKCVPCDAQIAKGAKHCRPCFNRSIGLCPGVCTGEVSRAEYRKIIRRIALFFEAKKPTLIKSLERDMQTAARDENFEEAAQLRKQIFALNHIQDVSLIKDEYRSPSTSFGAMRPWRIEAYDAAHLRGTAAVGVMTVVEDGAARPSEYRKFRLRQAKAGDDPGALKEILSRRLGHEEWPMPRLIVVDGATAQINVAESLLKELGIKIPVVGVVKDEKHRPREIRGPSTSLGTGDRDLIKDRERDILLANAEAHRFAIGYHRKKSRKELLG